MSRVRIGRFEAGDLVSLAKLYFSATIEGSLMPFFLERKADILRIQDVRGTENDIAVARIEGSDGLAAYATHAHRQAYVAGRPRRVGNYLEMFIHPAYRRGMLMGRLFHYLRDVVVQPGEISQVQVALSNQRALDAFASLRAGLPGFYPYGKQAFVIIPRDSADARKASDTEVRRATSPDIPAMQAFHDEWAPTKNFYPRYDFSSLGEPYYRGLSIGDYFLALRNGRIVGMTGIWDQIGFKAIHYLDLGNTEETVTIPGERFLFLHSLLTESNSPVIFAALMNTIRFEYGNSEYLHLSVGLDATDPLRAGLDHLNPKTSFTHHFLLSYEQDPRPFLKPGPFYLEAARC